MTQEIIVYIVFAAALLYTGFRFWKMLKRKDCGGGCPSCGKIDVDAIERQIRSAEKHP